MTRKITKPSKLCVFDFGRYDEWERDCENY